MGLVVFGGVVDALAPPPPPPQPATTRAASGITAPPARNVMGLLRIMLTPLGRFRNLVQGPPSAPVCRRPSDDSSDWVRRGSGPDRLLRGEAPKESRRAAIPPST